MGAVAKRIVDAESVKWMDDPYIKCKDPLVKDLFYPENPSADVQKAKAICNGAFDGVICPKRAECRHFAIEHRESHGVWGGMSERDRRKVQKARKSLRKKNIYSLEDVKFPGVKTVKRRPLLVLVKSEPSARPSKTFRTNVSGSDQARKRRRSAPPHN